MNYDNKQRLANKRAYQAGKGIGVEYTPPTDEFKAKQDARINSLLAQMKADTAAVIGKLVDAAENGNNDGKEALWARYAIATGAQRHPSRQLTEAQVEAAITWGKGMMGVKA